MDTPTTSCDLRKHTIFDVVVGRSEAVLEDYVAKLPGKGHVRMVCKALNQLRGQTFDPKVIKHSWENTFDRL